MLYLYETGTRMENGAEMLIIVGARNLILSFAAEKRTEEPDAISRRIGDL